MNNQYFKFIDQRGATLLELLVAIFIIIIMVSVFGSVFWSVNLNREIKYKSAAHFLALGEMETVRKIPFAKLTNRANANFIGVAYNMGVNQVQADGTAPSLPNAYSLSPAAAAINNLTSLSFVPGDSLNDFGFEIIVKASNTSPLDWQTGIVFRYEDIDNYYRFILNSSAIKLEKVINGSTSILYSTNRIFNVNAWYKLKATASDSTINLYLDDTPLAIINDTDLSRGAIGLAGLNSAQVYFDNVALTSASTANWSFDSDTEGLIPVSWERFGINDLPQGQGKLTIENYNGDANIKKVTVQVGWNQKQRNKTIQLMSLIGQYGINP
jgi:type II secretory pathway pseudopilin PulG